MPTKAVILPVGNSPAHCYRVLRSLLDGGDFDLFILAVTEETKLSGELIQKIISSDNLIVEVIDYKIIKDTYDSSNIIEWNIFAGPGTMKMFLEILDQTILLNNQHPSLWCYHHQKTKNGNIKQETVKIICVNDNRTISGFINIVKKNTALKLYDVDNDIFRTYDNLEWVEGIAKFSYAVKVPQEAIDYNKIECRDYENQIIHEVNILQSKIGKHSINFKMENLPNTPDWAVLLARINQHYKFKGRYRLNDKN